MVTKGEDNVRTMVKEKSRRVAAHYYLFLEDSEFDSGDLIDIHTNKRDKMIKKIRSDLMLYNVPESLRKELLDVAIVIHLRKGRYKTQDLDNIAKIILDALQKPKNSEDSLGYLYENDNQIIRLLLYKIEREEDPEAETSQLSISARKHNPNKEMILKEQRMV